MVPLTSLTRSCGLVAEGCGAEYAAGSGTAPGSPGSIMNPAVFRLSVGKWLKFGEWFEIVLPRQWLKIEWFGGGFPRTPMLHRPTYCLLRGYVNSILKLALCIPYTGHLFYQIYLEQMWNVVLESLKKSYWVLGFNLDPTVHVKLFIQTGLSDFAWVEENSPI